MADKPNLAPTNSDGTDKDSPKVINAGDTTQSGGPTTPSTARGSLKDTTISQMNSSLEHVCDVTGPLVYSIAYASFQIGQAIQAIRTYLQGIWASASASPFGDAVRGAIKFIQASIEFAKKILAKVQEAAAAVRKFIQDMTDLIAYIATFPAKVAAMLIKCVKESVAQMKLAAEEQAKIDEAVKSTEVAKNLAASEKTLSENQQIADSPQPQNTQQIP